MSIFKSIRRWWKSRCKKQQYGYVYPRRTSNAPFDYSEAPKRKMIDSWLFEVYIKGPNGETGWEIEVGYVNEAKNRKDAISQVKDYFGDKFDEIILIYECNISKLYADRQHLIEKGN